MKGTKHSRHSSESTSARRRESQRTNNLAQVQAYQQQLNGGYYPSQIPGAEVEVYEPGGGGGGYQPSPGLAPPAPYQYHQRQEVEHDEDAEGSSSSRGWQDEAYLQQINQLNAQTQQIRRHQAAQQQMAQQQQLQQQQQQQLRLEKENENKSKSLLDIKHRPSSGAWSMRDDQQLISARMQNLNWSQIQQKYFPGKSSNACRKRHERLIDSKGRGNDETIRLERIAVEYVNMREELWSPLAKKTGENWKYIERQCFGNGLKNLQGVSRTASRRQRFEANAMANMATTAATGGGYDDDSGVSGIGMTPVDEVEAAYSSSPAPSPNAAAQSFASTATATTTYLQHPQHPQHQLAHAHLHPAAAAGAYAASMMYGTQYQPQHAYSSSISSEGSLHPGYVSRRGNESA